MKKGERRKQELLKIAYDLFLSKGYENTSVDEIIDAAGIAKGTYYYYFQSKEQTLEEVTDMMLDSEEERARGILESDISLPEKLVGIISSFRPEGNEAVITDTLNRPENILMHDKINRRLNERVIPLLSRVVEDGVKDGVFSCDHIPERIRMIVILSREIFEETDFSDADISVFIDVVEKILGTSPGTMGFIRMLIENS